MSEELNLNHTDRLRIYAYWIVRTGSEVEAFRKAYGGVPEVRKKAKLRKSKIVRLEIIRWVGILMEQANIDRGNIIQKTEKLLDICLEKAGDASPAELTTMIEPLKNLLELIGGNWAGLNQQQSLEKFSMSMDYSLPRSKLREVPEEAKYEVLDASQEQETTPRSSNS